MKKIIHVFVTILSFVNLCIFYSVRSIWFFVNQEIDGNPIWSNLIFFVLLIIFIVNLLLLIKVKVLKFRHLLMTIPVLIFIGVNAYLIYMLRSEKHIIIRNTIPLIPYFVIVVLLGLLIQTKYKFNRLIKSVLAITICMVIIIPKLNLQPVKITSGPNFSYVDDELVVIWTTNVKSTGLVEVGQERDLKKVTSSENGIINGNSTHFKVVLSDIKDGDVIRVGSQKIKAYYQNNVVYGKTAYSDYIVYEDTRDNPITSFYVLSDIHERKDVFDKYLNDEDYDFMVFNGDIISSIDEEELIISEFLEPITNDEVKPFYFVRGNHETRGADARVLDDYLALKDNKYYYTFSYGPVFIIVLDTGEDKLDNHIEYGGLADYNNYRQEQTRWLESVVEEKDYEDYEYIIALSHIPLLKDDAFPYKEEWMSLLSEIQVDVLLSGHTHKSEIIETESIPIVIGGGYINSNSGYEGIKVLVGETLVIDVIDEDGKIQKSFQVQ